VSGEFVQLSVLKLTRRVARILRCLCTIHIFEEIKDNHYVNSPTSQYLVRNEPLTCWLLLHTMEVYTASDHLPSVLFGSNQATPGSQPKSAFQVAYGLEEDFWQWLEQPVQQLDGTVTARPERDIWIQGMWRFGLEYVQAPAVCDDFPWDTLGPSTVVDVGAGVGGMSLELAQRYSDLRFVVEDRPAILQQAETTWLSSSPDVMQAGRVSFVPHNFFEEQPVKGADVYILRHILHDWADEECVTILTHLRRAMGANSRVLVADNVMHTTAERRHLKAAPPPLPANYGTAHSFANMHDLFMFTMFNGGERTAGEFAALAERAGLKVTRIWECRGLTSITEMRRQDYAL